MPFEEVIAVRCDSTTLMHILVTAADTYNHHHHRSRHVQNNTQPPLNYKSQKLFYKNIDPTRSPPGKGRCLLMKITRARHYVHPRRLFGRLGPEATKSYGVV